MGESANRIYPYAIAAVLPPVGLILSLIAFQQEEQRLGVSLIAAALLGALIWALILVL